MNEMQQKVRPDHYQLQPYQIQVLALEYDFFLATGKVSIFFNANALIISLIH
jgi:hypothetical protein